MSAPKLQYSFAQDPVADPRTSVVLIRMILINIPNLAAHATNQIIVTQILAVILAKVIPLNPLENERKYQRNTTKKNAFPLMETHILNLTLINIQLLIQPKFHGGMTFSMSNGSRVVRRKHFVR